MVRQGEQSDFSEIMRIWLDTNIETHNFISPDYWRKNYERVESMMHEAELYVCEKEECIRGFIGLRGNYIAGIFVDKAYRGAGIGKDLLDYVKTHNNNLVLHVYEKNKGAVRFYIREGFIKEKEQVEEINRETEYEMQWRKNELREESGI